ncbi:uncharacterized protein LOC129591595 [Paramacrobiotus metropolitanus]|uniref:uncharacterized protein LOC129591595 n=1 Tax=Paramacrobiotus metropolitanus TaxID=2943436 RepID=UPI002445AED3|nr:uncharacterized protein LOC129591595 [Paramacrobiotus metropolitanus]
MKIAIVLSCFLVGTLAASNTFSHQYVFDWMKVLTNQEIYALLAQRVGQWPERGDYDIPAPGFTCAEKEFPGYYADPATQCQTFHRCDINGNMTSYICVNRTLFNPITLVCDHWFNVDCVGFIRDEYFANRRLYTSEVLFDTPNQGPPPTTTTTPAPITTTTEHGKWVWVDDNAAGQSSTQKPRIKEVRVQRPEDGHRRAGS